MIPDFGVLHTSVRSIDHRRALALLHHLCRKKHGRYAVVRNIAAPICIDATASSAPSVFLPFPTSHPRHPNNSLPNTNSQPQCFSAHHVSINVTSIRLPPNHLPHSVPSHYHYSSGSSYTASPHSHPSPCSGSTTILKVSTHNARRKSSPFFLTTITFALLFYHHHHRTLNVPQV
jgi:hypothetical protein